MSVTSVTIASINDGLQCSPCQTGISGSPSQQVHVNQDLMDDIKSIILEILMKLSTESQNELLVLYATVIQSMFKNLRRIGLSETLLSSLHHQFDFIVVVNINVCKINPRVRIQSPTDKNLQKNNSQIIERQNSKSLHRAYPSSNCSWNSWH